MMAALPKQTVVVAVVVVVVAAATAVVVVVVVVLVVVVVVVVGPVGKRLNVTKLLPSFSTKLLLKPGILEARRITPASMRIHAEGRNTSFMNLPKCPTARY